MSKMTAKSFAERMKHHQLKWAKDKDKGQLDGMLEDQEDQKHRERPWVLKDEYKKKNLYGEKRWCIGREYRSGIFSLRLNLLRVNSDLVAVR